MPIEAEHSGLMRTRHSRCRAPAPRSQGRASSLSTMQGTIMTNCMRQGLRRSGVPMILMLSVVAGCGDDDLGTRYRVSGHVTRQGQPVTKGTVNFMPVDLANSRAASGEIQSDGSYALTTKD